MKRAFRRHRDRVAKIHHDNIYMNFYGWRRWVEDRGRWNERQRRRPIADLIMTEHGHKHWRKVMMTAPDRAEEHQSLRAVLRGIDVDELPWPRYKGRWVYYW